MATLALQCLYSVIVIASALLCLAVTRRASGNPHQDAAWRLTGVAFLWHGTTDGLQNVFGGIAMAAGEGSPQWSAYMRWLPVMNQSRTFLQVGLMVALATLVLWRGLPSRRFWSVALAALATGYLLGIVVGAREGRFSATTHFGKVAVWDVMELVAVLVTLFALLVSNRADRLLWAFLSAYGLGLALGVFWVSQVGRPGTWQPPYWTLAAMRAVCGVIMLAAVARRTFLQQRGRRVRGMLEPGMGPLPSFH